MASLFTNVSAMTALQTLSSVSKNLADTQSRISTGLRINDASDNAAYWSIATTLRSDVGALVAVGDALGLGASTVDTVYTGMDNAKNLLTQIKEKLVTATTPGIPRAQVQAEITELQNRLKDGASSTVINSESWLTQDSSADGYNSIKSVVGSFTRAAGTVTIDTIDIDISKTKLYETADTAHSDVDTVLNGSTGLLAAYSNAIAAGPVGLTQDRVDEIQSLDDLSWDIMVFAATLIPPIDTSAIFAIGDFYANRATWRADFEADDIIDAVIADVTAIDSEQGRALSDMLTAASDARTTLIGAINNAADVLIAQTPATPGAVGFAIFDLGTAVGSALTTAFDRSTLTAESGFGTAGEVAAAARKEFETAVKSDTANNKLGILDKVRAVVSEPDGTPAQAISVANIDISKLTDSEFDRGIMQAYVKAVDTALQELTLSASVLGASKARIEGNQTFVKALVDANNRGIGQLVDADLNEESTRLKALQTQQQLAVQSLGIANRSSDGILQLFQ